MPVLPASVCDFNFLNLLGHDKQDTDVISLPEHERKPSSSVCCDVVSVVNSVLNHCLSRCLPQMEHGTTAPFLSGRKERRNSRPNCISQVGWHVTYLWQYLIS